MGSVAVAWLYDNETRPSTRIRVRKIADYLDRFDIQSELIRSNFDARCPSELNRRPFDVVVIQKHLPEVGVLRAIRRSCRMLCFDFDDAVYTKLNTVFGAKISLKRRYRFAHMMAAADLVIAGNEILALQARQSGAESVIVVPSAVYAPPLMQRETVKDIGTLTLGWIGGKENIPYLDAFLHQVQPYLAEPARLKLRVISNMAYRHPQFAVENIPWSEATEYDEIDQFDIGLMPMPDNAWTRGKCAYKALQYISRSVPVVAADVGVTRDWLEGCGLIYSDVRKAADFLNLVSHERSELDRFRAIGRQRYEEKFAPEVIAAQLGQALVRLV